VKEVPEGDETDLEKKRDDDDHEGYDGAHGQQQDDNSQS